MLHFSAIINWNIPERNIESAFEVIFFYSWQRKIGFKSYITLIHQTELAFPSYENEGFF